MDLNLFTSDQLKDIGIVALIATFVISAVNLFDFKLRGHWLALIVCVVITILRTTFTPHMKFGEWQVLLTNVLITTSFAMLFWTYLGQYTVDKIFAKLKKLIGDKLQTGAEATDTHA